MDQVSLPARRYKKNTYVQVGRGVCCTEIQLNTSADAWVLIPHDAFCNLKLILPLSLKSIPFYFLRNLTPRHLISLFSNLSPSTGFKTCSSQAWLAHCNPSSWEAEIWRVVIRGQLGEIVLWDPIPKITRAKRTGSVAQAVKYLLCKHKHPRSNPSPTKSKQKTCSNLSQGTQAKSLDCLENALREMYSKYGNERKKPCASDVNW
jgi:hypothetical protein